MSFVTRIAGIEIPVANLKESIAWYEKVLGLKVIGEYEDTWKEAMLGFPNHPAGIYLVQTDSSERLKYQNTNYGYTQSVIDF